MAKHRAITTFMDLMDTDQTVYEYGDPYPKKGKAKKARLDELLSSDNKMGTPVIEVVDEGDD